MMPSALLLEINLLREDGTTWQNYVFSKRNICPHLISL